MNATNPLEETSKHACINSWYMNVTYPTMHATYPTSHASICMQQIQHECKKFMHVANHAPTCMQQGNSTSLEELDFSKVARFAAATSARVCSCTKSSGKKRIGKNYVAGLDSSTKNVQRCTDRFVL